MTTELYRHQYPSKPKDGILKDISAYITQLYLGAFIFAYLILLVLVVFPLASIEAALGQHSGKSVAKIWGIIPLFKGKLDWRQS